MTDLLTLLNNFRITLHVVVTAIVTICLTCFGLSLDRGQRLSASGGLCPDRPDLQSGSVLSTFSLLCKLHEI